MSGNGGHTPWVVRQGNGYSATAPTEQWILVTPKHGANGRLLFWHHGSGGETVFAFPGWDTDVTPSTSNIRTNLHRKIMTPLIDAGYSILACDFGGANTFGNAASVARITDAISFASGTLGFGMSKYGWVAESMGSAAAFVYSSYNPTNVAVICTYLTLADLDDAYTNVAGIAAILDAAFPPNWAANSALHNPISTRVYGQFVNAGLAPYWRGYYASDDPIASPTRAQNLAAAMGVSSHAISLGTGGHADTAQANIDTVELVRFINAGRW